MTVDILHLARKNIQKLEPYQSARRIGGKGEVWLNANESPTPISFFSNIKSFNRYPEFQPKKLIQLYSKYVNISEDQILITRGADEGIELLMKSFCEPGKDAIIYCPPTYDMYGINAKIFGIEIKEILMLKNSWKIDISNIISNLDKVKLIYICNPNNPTGNLIHSKDLLILLKATLGRAILVIDEAYIEFSSKNSMVNFLKEYSNLIILRTLSKAFSLAGIRCGFVLASKEIINILHKVISPYPISSLIADIACQALHDNAILDMKNRVNQININRSYLVNELKKIIFIEKIFKSHANYILVKLFHFEKVFWSLWHKGIILRNQNHKINLKRCLRISVGSDVECLRLINELKRVSKKNIL
ncbi:histidinol-phosphate transaminase [Buchnera aphidicola (Melanaphis sacchari)]|uniref:Histidinol-phosphate aminotransferase n=1 Tax=Buchnera aphidicola (Melanaphis sacchari) TaxID=2173854 RepID=A0A2U8DHE8_9GAMM|nr:histidinol-phosphate transaminase [Buchnera aphidicola]AWH90662.1 histidinol-phosphate transaminase [Buchnera aphidicola (Melanaphis sacchari)]